MAGEYSYGLKDIVANPNSSIGVNAVKFNAFYTNVEVQFYYAAP